GSNLGNVDEALGRFTKEFKKVKSGISGDVDTPITQSQYKKLRRKTPSNAIRKMVNPAGTKVDPVYGYTVEKLEADHIVSMKVITDMKGFSQLSEQQQIEILNLKDNFFGLSKSSNASKGAKSGQIGGDIRKWEILLRK
ncbi:hypothetical protein, partial [Clostridium estertheticum]|nr:hypothetical protein [Clostridium estertheticum]